MSSFLAKKLGAKKTMILVNNISYMDIIPKRFIDNVVAPYRLTISLVMQDLREADFAQDVLLKMHLGAEAIGVLFTLIPLLQILLESRWLICQYLKKQALVQL